MNETVLKVTRKQAASILAATFPEYRGRSIKVVFENTITFYDTNWGGGTRNVYKAIASDGRVAQLQVPAPWLNMVEGKSVEIPQNALVVEHSDFCGHDCGITIHAHTSHLPKWIEARNG